MSLKPNLQASDPSREINGGASFLIGYQLRDKHVVVVGGGKEAANRTFFALDSDAKITLISPGELHPALMARSHLMKIVSRKFIDKDLFTHYDDTRTGHEVDMVLCCIDDPIESKRIAQLCRKYRIPVNCADIPELCDFYFMAQYRNGPLQIGVSTNGGGPRLGVRIRNEILKTLDPATPEAVEMIAGIRSSIRNIDETESKSGPRVIASRMKWITKFCDEWNYYDLLHLKDPNQTKIVLDAYRQGLDVPIPPSKQESQDSDQPETVKVDDPVSRMQNLPIVGPYVGLTMSVYSFIFNLLASPVKRITQKRPKKVKLVVINHNLDDNSTPNLHHDLEALEASETSTKVEEVLEPEEGVLYLAGAGPGDPDLLTRQVHMILEEADYVVSDRLVPPLILGLVNPAKLVLVQEKTKGKSDLAQDESNELVLKLLDQKLMVVRLKTGDPFIYGRGGEEILYFRERGYDPIVCPGISSITGGPTMSMVPLTHRGVADSILVLSGRGQNGSYPVIPPYDPKRTTVLLMVMKRVEKITEMLLEQGYPPNLDSCILEKACWPQGRIHHLTLEHTPTIVKEHNIASPSMWILGNCCKVLDQRLFEKSVTKPEE